MLAPVLESLVIVRGKIADQRAAEARDVTAQMQTDLQEGVKREAPKIQETLELMRRRFDDIIKPKVILYAHRHRRWDPDVRREAGHRPPPPSGRLLGGQGGQIFQFL